MGLRRTAQQAADHLGVSKNTLLRWEALELIPKPPRDPNGHRYFTEALLVEIRRRRNPDSEQEVA
jgi:DNA-binding transcriptional MerR regulator